MSKNIKNNEIAEQFASQVASGSTFIVAKEPTSNPDYTMLYLAQSVKTSEEEVDSKNFFLGWNNSRIIRAMHNSATAIANKLKVGQVVPFDILVEEKVSPQWEGQQPKINPSTGQVIEFEGMAVYEHSSIVPAGQGAKIVKLAGSVSQSATAAYFKAAEMVEKSKSETAKF